MKSPDINQAYHIPQAFYEKIKKYIDERIVISHSQELFELWNAALYFRNRFPEHQEAIAEWTVSVAASSPLVNDNDAFEAIHAAFGILEVDSTENAWKELGKDIKKLAASTKANRSS